MEDGRLFYDSELGKPCDVAATLFVRCSIFLPSPKRCVPSPPHPPHSKTRARGGRNAESTARQPHASVSACRSQARVHDELRFQRRVRPLVVQFARAHLLGEIAKHVRLLRELSFAAVFTGGNTARFALDLPFGSGNDGFVAKESERHILARLRQDEINQLHTRLGADDAHQLLLVGDERAVKRRRRSAVKK